LNIFFGEKNIKKELEIVRQQANWARYQPGQAAGHYESFFQRVTIQLGRSLSGYAIPFLAPKIILKMRLVNFGLFILMVKQVTILR
jgi:hypothetical protein